MRRVLRMDMNDVVQTDAFLAFMVLSAVGDLIAGALIVAHVIEWPLSVGICGIVGGLVAPPYLAYARRVIRSKRTAQ